MSAFIYEYIRTRGCKPIHFAQHIRHLEGRFFRKLFYDVMYVTKTDIYNSIVNKLSREGFSDNAVNAVCLKFRPFYNNPEVEIEELYYDTFSLRAIRPKGQIYYVNGDAIKSNSSVKLALLEFNRMTAEIADEGVSIWVNEESEILAIDGASVIAVFEDEIRFSSHGYGVEFDIAYERFSAKRKHVTRGSIYESDLMKAKEIIYIDYRGVTVLESYDSHPYMDIIAEKIAAEVAATEE